MMNITVKEVVDVTNGKLLNGNEDVILYDICIDSRMTKEGDLFVPIIGEKTDGHYFIEQSLDKCSATLTSRPDEKITVDKPYILVDETVKALQDIGAYVRSKFDIPFIGVTGSVGKTTTREMIATALSGEKKVYRTSGNHNSQIGTPLSLSRIDEDAEMAVIEMGMSEEGQMDILSHLVKPDICVISKIGVAHIEFLKTKENIRKEKLSIINAMSEDGALFLNGDDDMLEDLKGKTGVRTIYYGTKEWCDYRAENIHMENYQYVYDYVHGDERIKVILNALGNHNVINSLAGLAIADYMGLDVSIAAKQFETFKGLRQKLLHIPNKYTIIDDTYNASPDSMKASLDVLDKFDVVEDGRKLAVLGDMFELGENSEKYHYETGEYLAKKKIDDLIVVGELSQHIADAVEANNPDIKCYRFKDNGEVALYLLSVMRPQDIVLIKGSNGMHLNEIVSNLLG
ncbi:MAG: UDP-N-acetylmuramoyl-tripeptide--D-alanyl-D-alanine ligase [Lachnospiraceae bacterium]|nr:UDP-N-acetylmuramoyl-tripeptide--D-alanyl-D-alanine ligase [Lachnospiraceae bacterium]